MKHAGKRLLAVLLAVVMVLGSVGVVSAEDTSGSGTADDVTITTGFTANTGNITLSGDFKLTYTFTNVSTGSSSWENFIVEMFNENYVYVDVRADNYGWLANTTSAADTFSVGTGLDSWTDWLAATQSGMDFTVTVVRTGGFVQVITSSDEGTFYANAYVDEYADGCDLTVHLTGEQCILSDISYSYAAISDTNNVTASAEGTADDVTITTGFTANTGNITLSGDFELTYTFTNVSTGSSSWENFIVEMFNDSYVYVDVRADNYGWIANQTSAADTFAVGTGLDSWTDWLAATQSGIDFTVTVIRTGGFVQVITSSDEGTFYANAYVEEYADGCDVTVHLTGEQCELSGISYGYTAMSEDDSVVSFLGGSLRMKDSASDYSSTNLRFGYTITLPEGAELTSWYWNWGTDESNLSGYVEGVNKVDDETITTNLVITDIPSASYDTTIYSQLVVVYELDGVTYMVTDSVQSRSVNEVATAILSSSDATAEEITYANGILGV